VREWISTVKRPPRSSPRLLLLIAAVALSVVVVVAIGQARSPDRGADSTVAPVPERLVRVLNSSGPMRFSSAGPGARPTVTRRRAMQKGLRGSLWRPASVTGISLVRVSRKVGAIPGGTLAWLVSVKPQKSVYDGTKTAPGRAGNYFVVLICARNGRFLGAADGYSPALANRSGSGAWMTAQFA
jgi:hypothetical protein